MNNNILVLGANGQLGQCLQKAATQFNDFSFTFLTSRNCDITQKKQLENIFNTYHPNIIINAAAYTKVDLAEDDQQKAYLVNAEAVEEMATLCKKNNVILIHISTDYVFDGKKDQPYEETDPTHPINVYGASKCKGEQAIMVNLKSYYIIRTSWLYSEFGSNFYTAMQNKIGSGASLKITKEQIGCPTNANDLAKVILKIISSKKEAFGLYHFCNNGEATWYDFAYEIFKNANALDDVQLSSTDFYPTKAKRPRFSVMNTNKIKSAFGLDIVNWKESLKQLQA